MDYKYANDMEQPFDNSMIKYYKRAVYVPAIISLIAQIVYSAIDLYNYKSEWMTGDSFFMIETAFTLINALIIAVLCLPILIIKYPQIKNHKMLTAVFWFVLPMIWISLAFVVLIHDICDALRIGETIKDFVATICFLLLPYLIGLIWSYVKYIRRDGAQTATVQTNI